MSYGNQRRDEAAQQAVFVLTVEPQGEIAH